MKKIILLLVLCSLGCSQVQKREPLSSKSNALRQVVLTDEFSLSDDLQLKGLAEGLFANIQHLKSKPAHKMQFGEEVVSSGEYLLALERLYNVIQNSPENFNNYLLNHFNVYEVYGKSEWGEVFITSYFAPEIKGSLTKTSQFSQALFAIPKDMVIVRLGEYGKTFGDRLANRICLKGEPCKVNNKNLGILRGRLVKKEGALSEVVPYYSRKQIDEEKVKLPAKVLAYVDPVDAFFLQIQGSGTVVLPDGEKLQVGYAGQNGHSYQAIGKYLFDVIPKEKMSLQTIETHLNSLSLNDKQKLLNKNPSYIFFKQNEAKPFTYFGIETIDGRTIATDKRYFPKGALGILHFKKPIFSNTEAQEPQAWQDVSRFVFDHDTGGAIKGGGRVDLFWGAGALAKQAAGVMKHYGQLYYFKPKHLLTNDKP